MVVQEYLSKGFLRAHEQGAPERLPRLTSVTRMRWVSETGKGK